MTPEELEHRALTLALSRGLVNSDFGDSKAVTRPLSDLVDAGYLDEKTASLLRKEVTESLRMTSPGFAPLEALPVISPFDLFPLQKEGRYQPEVFLGEGGMGRVFRVFDRVLKRRIAIKFLHVTHPTLSRSLLREGQAQAKIDNPHVVHIYEAGEIEGIPFLSMQYIDGPTFKQAMPDLTLMEKVDIVRQAALGVSAGHQLGIIHRDIKPGNILLERTPQGGWKALVTDFGLAKDIEEGGLTLTANIMGTPSYMSPEQIHPEYGPIGVPSDIYSFGVTLYEALTLKAPFSGTTVVELFRKILEEDPQSMHSFSRDIPIDLDTIIQKCLEKQPSMRYESVAELANDLDSVINSEAISLKRHNVFYKINNKAKKHKKFVAIGVLVLVVSSIGFTWTIKSISDLNKSRLSESASNLRMNGLLDELKSIKSMLKSVDGEISRLQMEFAKSNDDKQKLAILKDLEKYKASKLKIENELVNLEQRAKAPEQDNQAYQGALAPISNGVQRDLPRAQELPVPLLVPANPPPPDNPVARVVNQVAPIAPLRAAQMRWDIGNDHYVRLKVLVNQDGKPVKVTWIREVLRSVNNRVLICSIA